MGLLERICGLTAGLRELSRRLSHDTRGNVAMILGFTLPVLLLLSFGGIDLHRLTTVRVNLQDALDAAALAAARSPYEDEESLNRIGRATLRANLAGYSEIRVNDQDLTFALRDEKVIVANARVEVKTVAAHIFLPPYGRLMDEWMPVGAHSEVDRATKDLEVALVLDITGSMAGNRLRDLKQAANDLVDIVIPVEPSVNRTRIALVPYSMGVNAGTYANAARGAIRQKTDISTAAWAFDGTPTLSGITIAGPGVFSASNHGLVNGAFVYVTGVTQKTGTGTSLPNLLNNKIFRVANVNGNNFELETGSGSNWTTVNTTGRRAYNGGGQFRRCVIATCEYVVTSDNHGLAVGEDIRMRSLQGLTNFNNDDRRVSTVLDTNQFVPSNAFGPDINQTHTASTGDYVQCLELGCQFYKFTNYNGSTIIKEPSTCVSERHGTYAHTDTPSGTTKVGLTYPSTDNPCLSNTITPLTDDRDLLHSTIGSGSTGYQAVGSTAGQIGIEWGWYMVSQRFGVIFPSDSQPEAASPDRLKIVILMTDGEFNTPYCDGVVAGAMSGSGDAAQHIRCPTTVSNPFQFAVDTCQAMKNDRVIVYTVGLAISSSTGGAGIDTAKEVMDNCATSPQHAFFPADGGSLKNDFAAIARSISQLRISK